MKKTGDSEARKAAETLENIASNTYIAMDAFSM